MTPGSTGNFLEWLDIEIAEAEAKEVLSNNGYQGYPQGYAEGVLDGLKSVRAYFTGE